MTDIASYIRIFEASPSDDFVEKRQTAITALADSYRKRSAFVDIIGLAEGLAGALAARGKLPDALAGQVEAALKEASPSFVLEESPLEAKVCAVLAAVEYLEPIAPSSGAASRADILALGLWSALSFQKPLTDPKLDKLRAELLGIARNLAARTAENCRLRVAVPDGAFAPPEAEAWAGIEKKWKAGPLKTLDALRLNAALDREEIDVLWWVLGDWSQLYKKKLSAMPPRLAPLAAAWELTQQLKRIPAEAHKQLIQRLVGDGAAEALSALIKSLGDDRLPLAGLLAGDAMIVNHPHAFPLLNGLLDTGFKVAGDKEARGPDEWASRALLECGLLRATKLPVPIS
jgi:hypothetical protein